MGGNSYVPPFRRNDGAGDPGRADGPNQDSRYNNRGRSGGRGYRGYRGFGRGGGRWRGGEGGYNPREYSQQRPEIDESDLRTPYEIHQHFWNGQRVHIATNATFHASKDCPQELSYLLLFSGANPRWANDRIIFAKSNLSLLPEFAEKKAERKDWAPEVASGDQDSTVAAKQDGTESTTQDNGAAPAELSSGALPCSEDKKDMDRASTEAKGAVNNEAQAPPPPAPVTSSSRLKYTDIRKEEAAFSASTPTPSDMPQEMNIRTTPASQYYQESTFPTITPIDYTPTNPRPLAVFEGRRIPYYNPRNDTQASFAFKGWFKIVRINILAPRSAELVRMLQQKWERKDRFGNVVSSRPRDPAAWHASLAFEWAVVKLEPVADYDAPPPAVERLSRPPREETRGVNEMLADMRLNDGQKDEGDAVAKQGDETPGQE
ncbi:hypothetical protein GGS21DRAFT_417173 [Xylaria nigripes]|nr:hypothetical protein GGS21DRAFT_417173 [Xylaria nigripes]